MRATITAFNRALGNYQARTENDIAIAFSITDREHLKLGEVLEVDLLRLVERQQVVRVADAKVIAVRLGANDLHDLDLPSGHGSSRTPTPERLAGLASRSVGQPSAASESKG